MMRLRFFLVDVAILAYGGYFSGSSSYPSFASAEPQDTAGGLFSPEGPVSTMDRSTFISSVLESQRPALVWLYAGEDCDQCEEVAAMIGGAAPKLASWGLSVVAVDLSTETKLAKELGAPRSAAMMFKVYHSESTRNPYGGLPVRREEFINNFQDARTLQKKALSAIPNLVSTVNIRQDASTLRGALAENSDAKHAVVLLTTSGKASPVLRVLASVFGGKVAAIQARSSELAGSEEVGDEEEEEGEEETLRSMLDGVFEVTGGGITALPALILVDKEARKGIAYEGDVEDAEAMLAFVSEGAGIPLSSRGSSSSSSADTASGSNSDERGNDRRNVGGVLELDPESLSRLEEKGVEALVVAFVKEGDVSAVPGWGEAIKGLTGQIRAGVLDCTEHPDKCGGSGGRKAPYLRVYPHGKGVDGVNRGVPSVFSASEIKEALSEAEASLPEIVTIIPAGTSSQRTLDALQAFVGTGIIAEGAPMCLFVLSRREEPNLVVKTIAAQFQDAKMRTVFISQPEQETMAGLGVSKLPGMLLMFPAPEGAGAPNDGKPSEDGQQAMMTAHYSPAKFGPISHENVSNFILSHLSSVDMEAFFSQLQKMSEIAALNGEKLDANIERILQEQTQSSPGRGKRPLSPFEGVPEATTENWVSITGDATGYPRTVGVFVLDRFADNFETVFQASEAAAKRASGRLADSGSSNAFAWVDAPCHEGFASALGISDPSEVPVLVAYSPKHQRSARFVGAWDEESMGLFLSKALGGREPMFPLEGEEKPRLESVDCSQREPPSWQAGSDESRQGGIEDDELGDLMAEILAEEARAKEQLKEEVAKGLEELKEADKADTESTPKKKTKVVKRKKKKNASKKAGADSTRSEL